MNDRVEHTPPATMETVASKIQDLGDLELAILLSLVAEQHCIITTKSTLVESLARELQLVRVVCEHTSESIADFI